MLSTTQFSNKQTVAKSDFRNPNLQELGGVLQPIQDIESNKGDSYSPPEQACPSRRLNKPSRHAAVSSLPITQNQQACASRCPSKLVNHACLFHNEPSLVEECSISTPVANQLFQFQDPPMPQLRKKWPVSSVGKLMKQIFSMSLRPGRF